MVLTLFGDGTGGTSGPAIVSSVMNANLDYLEFRSDPIGSIKGWLKTFSSKSSGTADTNTVDKLVDSGATFITDGIAVGMIIHNTTDDTFGIVESIDSETAITIAADVQAGGSTTDIFPLGTEDYVIYATPTLNDNFVECNGQVLSDADSAYNGATIPDLNGSAAADSQRFLRGSWTSGTEGGSDDYEHTHSFGTTNIDSWTNGTHPGLTTNASSTVSALPTYYEVVMIMRVK